jgi:hypothetical protein
LISDVPRMDAICPNAALLVRESPSFQRENKLFMSGDYTLGIAQKYRREKEKWSRLW